MSKALREQTSRKALSRLLVDHSPPPGIRRRKRQRVDRTSGYTSSVPKEGTNPETRGTGKTEQLATGARNPELARVDYNVPPKLPVKNKV